jgi:hypothetical protein
MVKPNKGRRLAPTPDFALSYPFWFWLKKIKQKMKKKPAHYFSPQDGNCTLLCNAVFYQPVQTETNPKEHNQH